MLCVRRYRAPELLLRSSRCVCSTSHAPHRAPPPSCRTSRAATSYGPSSDVWAAGVIMAELLALAPLFPGDAPPPPEIHRFVPWPSVTLCPVPARLVGVRPALSHRWGVPRYASAALAIIFIHATAFQVLGPARDWVAGTRLAAAAGACSLCCSKFSPASIIAPHSHVRIVSRIICAFCPEVHSSDIMWQACRCRLSLRHRSSACFRRLLLRLPC